MFDQPLVIAGQTHLDYIQSGKQSRHRWEQPHCWEPNHSSSACWCVFHGINALSMSLSLIRSTLPIIVASTTLTPRAPVILSGTQYSPAPGSTTLVVGSSTILNSTRSASSGNGLGSYILSGLGTAEPSGERIEPTAAYTPMRRTLGWCIKTEVHPISLSGAMSRMSGPYHSC